MNGAGVGKEAWAGFGLAGFLAFTIDKTPTEFYEWTLLAICVLSIFSGLQRTLVKYMVIRYGVKEEKVNE